MSVLKRCLVLVSGCLLAAVLSACTIPSPGFADYDVSGYIQALLDSSYHGENEDLMAIAAITEEQALEYNTTTVENAAVTFCNTYGLSPSDEQLAELQIIMTQAFSLTKYTVKDERKTDTGYYLEVEVASITNFAECGTEIEELKEEARQEATAANNSQSEASGLENSTEGEESPEVSSAAAPGGETIDANTLFIDKVLDFCKRELANISYDQETRSLPLDIRQTDQGELQVDLNQIDAIDKTVVRFSE